MGIRRLLSHLMSDDDDRTASIRALADRFPPTRPDRPTIWYGSRGPDVTYLQERLIGLRVYRYVAGDAKHAPEGDDPGTFGAATDAAVRAAQGMFELPANGVVDAALWTHLEDR